MTTGLFNTVPLRRRKRKSDSDLDITPMIDVTFLLLIFFMVTSTMQSTPAIDLPVAVHGEGINNQQQVIVSVQNEARRSIFIAGDPPGPQMLLEEIVQYVREQLQTGKTGILVKASGETPAGDLKRLTQQLQALGEVQFYYGVSERD